MRPEISRIERRLEPTAAPTVICTADPPFGSGYTDPFPLSLLDHPDAGPRAQPFLLFGA